MKYRLDRFGKTDLKMLIDKLSKNFKRDKNIDNDIVNIIEYHNLQISLKDNLVNIEELKNEITSLKKECRDINVKMENIFKNNPHLIDDYIPNYNISKQNKKLANNSIGVFWIINLKYKGTNRSIYLGSDKKVREIVSTQLNTKRKLSEKRLKSEIYDMCFDKLLILTKMKGENLFDIKIKFEDLI